MTASKGSANRGGSSGVTAAGARPGLPSPQTVVLEMSLSSPNAPIGTTGAGARPNVYRVLRTTQVDPYDPPVTADEVRSAAPGLFAAAGDSFAGTARKAAKLTIAAGAATNFADVKKLIAALPPDDDMIHHKPKIGTGAKSARVSEEKKNVQVKAFLYAASREKDNDFHLIIGRDASATPTYMTIEVSGLPASSSASHAKLKKVRDDFKSFFQNLPQGLPGPTYDFYDPPIPLEVEGSIFFDVSHAGGDHPGPDDLRPDIPTIWEIHPVTRIVFEP